MATLTRQERWTVIDVLNWTATRFARQRSADVRSARLDAEVLLAHCLELDRIGLYTHHDKPLSAAELAAYRDAIRRRLAGQPVAQITGHREFWSLDFKVNQAVLTPRPETELLVEIALDYLRAADHVGRHESTVVDVGTGSGVIAVSLAHEYPSLRVHGTDISADALEIAAYNAALHGVEVTLHQGDLLDALPGDIRCHIIVANLPYIPAAELPTLAPEVSRWEPALALDGGADGLAVMRRLVPQAAERIERAGMLALEIAPEQRQPVQRLLHDHGFDQLSVRQDLGGCDRVVTGRRL